MKLDMRKTYDRVEWVFLEKVMRKLGLCDKRINLVMGRVKTISYSVLANRIPTNTFLPERGLR